MTELIGRINELKAIRSSVASGEAELVAIYGRRRVGKTYLVRQAFDDKFDFYITGVYHAPLKEQFRNFGDELRERTGQYFPNPKGWHEAFMMLQSYLEARLMRSADQDDSGEGKVIVFIDEIPWLDSAKSGFLREFDLFWNKWGSRQARLKLFVCGSATTWMLNKFVGDRGGLHNRVTHSIYLPPFTLGETEEYLRYLGISWGRYDIVECYMVFGGIPYYIKKLRKGLSVAQNVDLLCFSEGAELRTEFNFLFSSLFKEAKAYRRIVEMLARKTKGLTREELQKALRMDAGGKLTEYLTNLVKCDFVRCYHSFGKKKRGMIYQLTDLFTLFHLSFIDGTQGQDEHTWTNLLDTPQQNTWAGYAFEMVCLHHLPQIKQALGISGILSNCCGWVGSNDSQKGQIDLVIDRKDRVVNLCEMKFSRGEYNITRDYARKLTERRELFREVTETRAALHLTMVTTFGVKQNAYSSVIQNEVTMDEMFR